MRLKNALNTLLLFFVVGTSAAFGQTKYWDIDAGSQAGAGGTAPSGTWNASNSNWNTNSSGTGVPTTWTAGNVAVFAAGSDATGAYDVTVTGTQSLSGLTVEEGPVTQLGGTLDFGTTASAPVNIAAGSSWINSTGAFSGTGGLVKSGAGTLEFHTKTNNYSKSGSGNQAFLTILDGVVSIADERGLGAVPTVSGNATALTINGGTLRLGIAFDTTLASWRGVFIGANGGAFDVPDAVTLALPSSAPAASALSGSGTITKTGIGRFQLNTSQTTFTGRYVVKAGSLNFSADGVFGAVPSSPQANYFTLDGGALRLSVPTSATLNANRGITLGPGGGTLIGQTQTLSYAGTIAGTQGGGLTIALHDAIVNSLTSGSVALSGANTYDGPTQIETGMLLGTSLLANGGSNSGIGKSTNAAGNLIFNGGTLSYSGSTVSTDRNFTVTTAGGTIGSETSGASTLTFTSTAPIAVSGIGARTLTLRGNSTANNVLSAAVVDQGANPTTLAKTGPGTWVIANTANSYTGNTAISGGILKLGAAGVIPDGSIVSATTSGTLTLNGFDETVRSIAGSGGNLSIGTNVLTIDNPNGETYSGSISGATGRIIKNGTGALTLGSGTGFGGGVTLNAGTLGIGSSSALGTGTLVVNNSPKLSTSTSSGLAPTNAVTLSGNLTFDDSLTATPGAITWSTSGTRQWTITGDDRTVNVNSASGSFAVRINQIIGQDVPGRGLTKAGNSTLTLGALNTYTGDTSVEAGTLSLIQPFLADASDVYLMSGATMNLSVAAGSPDVIDSLFINGISQPTGTWGAFGSGAIHESIFFTGPGMLNVTRLDAPLPGDFNQDGIVDAGDYVRWQKNNGTNSSLPNDNGLGTPVGQAHYNLWRAKFGNVSGSGGGSTIGGVAEVPEPCTAAMLTVVALFAIKSRSRILRDQSCGGAN